MASFKLDLNQPEDIPVNICMNIILRGQEKYFRQQLLDVDINPAELPLLVKLYLNSGVTQRSIAESLYLTESSVAKSLKNLEAKGIISRRVDPERKNRNLVYLTSKGRNITSNLLNLGEEWENIIISEIPDNDRKVFKNVLYELCIKSAEFINGD